jgi:succinate dehydrogenase / fumarate reductase, cytochrome b subunit
MGGLLAFYGTSIGKKVVMAITGLIMVGFVVIHMIGNLKLYLPDNGEHLNHYAEYLKEIGEPILLHTQALWMFRIVLLLAVGLHILTAAQLTMMAWKGRDVGYNQRRGGAAVYLADMMRLGGVIIGGFIVYHILHFTTGQAHASFEPGEVYRNVILGFQNPIASAIYIVAMVALGVHLFHGVWSMFQSVGLNNKRWKMTLKTLAAAVAAVVMIGNISFPVSVLAGIVQL